MRRHELNERQWERLQPLLPPIKPKVGKTNLDHRPILNGMLWHVRTGAPWRDLPERYGSWGTVYSRFRRWTREGIWAKILAALQAEEDAKGNVDWEIHFADGSVVRAHQHAAGAKKGAAIKPSAAVGAASAPRSTSGRRAGASR